VWPKLLAARHTVGAIGREPPDGGLETKGGEALPAVEMLPEVAAPTGAMASWHVLWTRSNCEQLVHDQLAAQGFELFLPTIEAWVRRGAVRHRERAPLFRSYLFLRHAIDKESYLSVCRARGLVRIIGDRWDRLAVVPDREIEGIQTVLDSGLPVFPHPYLREGQRVRIRRGPLADVEGIVVRANARKGLLIVSVDLLQRSVAVHLDCTMLEAA
jgi:transcriptional antiterminator NusG